MDEEHESRLAMTLALMGDTSLSACDWRACKEITFNATADGGDFGETEAASDDDAFGEALVSALAFTDGGLLMLQLAALIKSES